MLGQKKKKKKNHILEQLSVLCKRSGVFSHYCCIFPFLAILLPKVIGCERLRTLEQNFLLPRHDMLPSQFEFTVQDSIGPGLGKRGILDVRPEDLDLVAN